MHIRPYWPPLAFQRDRYGAIGVEKALLKNSKPSLLLEYHVPGSATNNALPPSPFRNILHREAPLQSLPNVARARATPMDLSQTLRTERVVVTGPVLPESTQNEPNPTTLVIAGPVGRWTESVWVESFEEVSN
jgi:hypothetical protein